MSLENPAENRNALRVPSSRHAAQDSSAFDTWCLAKGESDSSFNTFNRGSGRRRSGLWIPSERSFLMASNSSSDAVSRQFGEAASVFREPSMARY